MFVAAGSGKLASLLNQNVDSVQVPLQLASSHFVGAVGAGMYVPVESSTRGGSAAQVVFMRYMFVVDLEHTVTRLPGKKL